MARIVAATLMSEPSDEELVASVVAARDAAAFETLVRRYQAKVRNWLRQLTKDAARADDLAQETFILAWRRASTFSGRGKFGSWIMKLAYNSYLQGLRKRKQHLRLVEAIGAGEPEPTAPDTHEWPDLPRMLAVLGPEERLTMILCYAHGLSHAEISEIIEMPLGTVKSHLLRGKAKIRERFELVEPNGKQARRR